MAATWYLIQPPPPVRAFAVAAVAALLGALLLVVSLSSGWHVAFAVIGGVLLVAGLALTALALYIMRQATLRLTLRADGYAVTGNGTRLEGAWREVTRVTVTKERERLTIHHHDDRRTNLVFPIAQNSQIDDVIADVRGRLDAARFID